MKTRSVGKEISRLLRTLGQPARLEILLAIGQGEACVCHLEALLGLRQAYISQHLMALRKAGQLATRREGRYIFYRLRTLETLNLIRLAGQVAGVAEPSGQSSVVQEPAVGCVCPSCVPEIQSV